ncbi:Putative outer membrane fimbrial usher porin precursor [Pseudomonas chlororaphis subsp. piscium]|uniref:fimbria/pilus outer membrane usher protein n=1 Tax=Pseudomonas chlororaphis TaxID=587753 RepID=UPI0006A5B9AE|nr:fimbria/pilus outer membrane usher protein [Pseudomonas chlororaphis]AZC32226.1 Putative outer membrane fimbrial usher porin precursor [Pseudomonas chlororaphis subsp. piscium]WDG89955.1 fimbrial biogenesis outer membrane usher protein [Pseudomonas chlororaphis]SDS70421.1 outer membrane usher protein [Pseudomonas chlororaphis]
MSVNHSVGGASLGEAFAACKLAVFFAPLLLAFLVAVRSAHASDAFEFDDSVLVGGASSADLARFSQGNPTLPGTYLAEIAINGSSSGREEVRLIEQPGRVGAVPCITVELLDKLGVDLTKMTGLDTQDRQACVDLGRIPSATAHFDSSEQRLDVSVPQVNMRQGPRGYVDPSRWDSGVTAGLLNYNLNSFYSSAQQDGAQNYLGLTGGINLGDWRLRQQSSLDWTDSTRNWQNRALYAQRDLQAIRSQLTLGDSSTSGDLFDSFSLRGLQLASDDRMLPDSLTGYAPVVRGVAQTNAKVTISQNSYVLRETTVAPGAFEITDLYPTGYGGDLDVTVTEADGQIQRYKVPYASTVRMLRPGSQRYNLALGRYRNGLGDSDRWVGQFTYQRGLTNLFTGYGGVTAANGYTAAMLGTALNTPLGAFGLDATHAITQLPGNALVPAQSSSGQSLRLSYSKSLPELGSTLSVATYRYSTDGYYSLPNAMSAMQSIEDGFGTRPASQRSALQLTLNQSLGNHGSLYLSGTARSYWERAGSDVQYQLGYSGNTRYFNYSLLAMRSQDAFGRNENQLNASVSIPLGGSVSMSSSASFGNRGSSGQVAMNGTSGEQNQYGWGASLAQNADNSSSANINGSYRGPFAELNASAGSGAGYRQSSLGVAGSVVAHPGGLTFGQPTGETIALVEAPNAAGAAVTNQAGLKLDGRGYAIVPYLRPYRSNTVDIDPRQLSTSVELKSTSTEVVPRAGAVVMAKFATVTGRVVLIDLLPSKGVHVPFGTMVTDEAGRSVGVVAQGQRIFTRGLEEKGSLVAKWGEASDQQCRINFVLPPRKEGSKPSYERLSAPCEPVRSSN